MIQVTAFKRMVGRRGFTLIELLVVVLILSVLMAIATPLYLSTIADSQKKVCRDNMRTIANAVQSARVQGNFSDYSTLIASGVTTTDLPDLQRVPICPDGGSYSLQNGVSGDATTFQVSCTVASHGTFRPGIDGY